jgi:hypothetical protein
MKSSSLVLSIACWTARVLAIGLFLFWGTFFLEHLQEWFLHPVQGLPPFWVWLRQLAHLIMLVGLIVLLRWELLGSIVTILGALAFFGPLVIETLNTPKGAWSFVLFLGITIIPAMIALGCWYSRSRAFPAPGA